ncbi:hypothetical protein BDV30DRAFT_228370 [Aspergillus minisclerotigenes]|uniref:DUF3669 domain-containing protein n=1 Tax=Aspergillus minisclerotigenes TaxID=656917 RepID=A0A5N6IXN9_9EURO|nr:hypothetical protein BDV30DRAFT_228370 [Aspergillus minisclerotigenes]
MTSRRENQRTDTSSITPQALLERFLSTRSVVSTSSSSVERQQAAVGWSIGKVFEQAGTLWAFKVLLIDRTDKLWNNYLMHLRIQDSFDRLGGGSGGLEIPRAAWFANKEFEFGSENLYLFPDDPTFPRRAREILCMERIFPLPQAVRHALIELFCNPNNVATAKSDASNKDCLVRLFLGRKRYGASRPGGSRVLSLRNYKLHVDQVEELQLDADEYAASMADALAIMHWHTRIDAMDIEFVLGSTPFDHNSVRRPPPLLDIVRLTPGASTFERSTNTVPNFKKRIAFIENDHYCPRPHTEDAYSEQLKITAGSPSQSLPQQFIQGVIAKLSPPDQTGTSSGSRGPAPPQRAQGDKWAVGAPLVARQRKLLAIEDEVEGRVEGIVELRIPVEYC